MALLDLADIPEEVGSFEALAVWCFTKLARLAQGRRFPIGEGGALVPACSAVVIEAADGRAYARLEAAIPCSLPDLNGAGSGSWMSAGALVGSAPAAGAEPPPPPPPPPPEPSDPLWASVRLLLGLAPGQPSGTLQDFGPAARPFTQSGIATAPDNNPTDKLAFVTLNSSLLFAEGSIFQLPGDYTVDFWLWSESGTDGILAGGGGSSAQFFRYNFQQPGRIIGYNSGAFDYQTAAGLFVPGVLTHWAEERVGGVTTLYKNGAPVASGTRYPPQAKTVSALFAVFEGRANGTWPSLGVRITGDVPRFGGPFTPPDFPFPKRGP